MSRVLTLKIWHPGCWTLDVTEELHGLELVANTISNSPSYVAADTMAIGSEDVLRSFLLWIKGDERVVHSHVLDLDAQRRTLRVFVRYTARDSIFSALLDHNVAPIEPIRATGGYEYWTVYTPGAGITSDILSDPRLSDCEIVAVSARDYGTRRKRRDPRHRETLTPRQLDISLKALEMGYYSWPRQVTAQELALNLGLSATTVREHLRKSESKIVRSFLLQVLEDDGEE